RGYTFYAEYATLSAAATFAAERRFARVWLGLAIFANYLYDPIVPFISSGIAVWAMYPLG
ncbi:MAG: hypothetical protein N2Z22_08775, partial [Turneriella sp.]|nr:hypothetical protein [Turneriella sp.]